MVSIPGQGTTRAVIKSKRERVPDLCSRKLLLVKILFEEVSFKASFEGRAVMESKRKRIPD